jgi:hypothetical protein
MNNDKKKLLILGVLALLMLGVGAFTFLSGGQSASPEVVATSEPQNPDETAAPEGEAAVGEEGEGSLEDELGKAGSDGTKVETEGLLALAPYAIRDPFSVPTSYDTRPGAVKQPEPKPEPVAQPKPEIAKPAARPQNDGYQPFNPGPLPSGPISGGAPEAPVVVTPNYRVTGILLGSKPLAVFEDANGNQKLVPLGGSVDGDTKVTSIQKGRVTVSHKGKPHTLVIEQEARND